MAVSPELTIRLHKEIYRQDGSGNPTSERVGYILQVSKPGKPRGAVSNFFSVGHPRPDQVQYIGVYRRSLPPGELKDLLPLSEEQENGTRVVVNMSKFGEEGSPSQIRHLSRAEEAIRAYQLGLEADERISRSQLERGQTRVVKARNRSRTRE